MPPSPPARRLVAVRCSFRRAAISLEQSGLQSGITLYLEAGARLIGTPDLDQYQQPTPPDFMPEQNGASGTGRFCSAKMSRT
jgi:hypothetical protein